LNINICHKVNDLLRRKKEWSQVQTKNLTIFANINQANNTH